MLDNTYICIREWERGTGETPGCGTGCCSVVMANRLALCERSVEVWQPGGKRQVVLDEQDTVSMAGPAYIVYQGEYDTNL
ncbi:MAG: hypothetical protein K2L18_10260 [Acetatifactor sp.]|nr:hypothetical protein [Acetatifactor sp.]